MCAERSWQEETVQLPFRRRQKSDAPASGGARAGKRSKGAERQARYRNKDPDGYRRRHREYVAAQRARQGRQIP
jgi:hypothetical protein